MIILVDNVKLQRAPSVCGPRAAFVLGALFSLHVSLYTYRRHFFNFLECINADT